MKICRGILIGSLAALCLFAGCAEDPKPTDNDAVTGCGLQCAAAGAGAGTAAPQAGISGTFATAGGGGAAADGTQAGAGGTGDSGGGAGASGEAGAAGAGPIPSGGCGQTLPAVTDYAMNGPFQPMTISNTGPDGTYTMIRPDTLGENGFVHPVATWGNGISTTPSLYTGLLDAIASHGFVIIASNSTMVTAAMLTAGLDWLIEQNAAAGDLQGKLDTDCAVTVGYSLGGRAAVDSGPHPAVVASVSFHGLEGESEKLHAPLLLFTSTADGFVTKSEYVQPCYDRSSTVPTILATMDVPGAPADFNGHLYPLGDAGEERAPAIAWLRLWVYGDTAARKYFYGSDCILSSTPWIDLQRKNASW